MAKRRLKTKTMTRYEAERFFDEHAATCTMCGVHHEIGNEYVYYYYEED